MDNKKSDFFLKPVKRPNWEYRIATWPVEQVDHKVHDLFDGLSIDPIKYQRITWRDGVLQNCTVEKDVDGNIILKPGNGFDYYVKRISFYNKEEFKIDNKSIPHNMLCDVCLINKKSHMLVDCNHVSMCGPCSLKVYSGEDNISKVCPICRTPVTKIPIKLLFT
jgi:hypothetical protein